MIFVKKHERGLLYKNGDYVKVLRPGRHSVFSILGFEAIIVDTHKPFTTTRSINLYTHDKELMKELEVIDIEDNTIALHYTDGHLKDIYGQGQYAFWNVSVKHEFKLIDLKKPEVDKSFNAMTLSDSGFTKYVSRFQVESYQKGLLFYDGVFQKELEPGTYFFWKGAVSVNVTTVDTRQLQLDMSGQEILTQDRVSVRINFVAQYKIIDVKKISIEINKYEEQLYIILQLMLREYVGTLSLDELLQKKEEINEFVLGRLKTKAAALGIEITFAGVKDIILPGDFKEIMNLVLIAERKAQANLVTRREEIASTRSLLNTAKLMEDNPTLYRLKELEYIERLAEKIGSISLMSGGSILEQLSSLVAQNKAKEK